MIPIERLRPLNKTRQATVTESLELPRRFETTAKLVGLIVGGLFLAVAQPLVARAASAADSSYVNGRYGYSISYPPSLLAAEPESDNGDGRHFHARRGDADMLVFASYNALEQTPSDIAADAAKECGRQPVAYRVVKAGLVAVSCLTDHNKVFYQKTLIRGDVLTTLQMTYPTSERSLWDKVCAAVAGSLRPGHDS